MTARTVPGARTARSQRAPLRDIRTATIDAALMLVGMLADTYAMHQIHVQRVRNASDFTFTSR
jgi:hypothetical protein